MTFESDLIDIESVYTCARYEIANISNNIRANHKTYKYFDSRMCYHHSDVYY